MPGAIIVETAPTCHYCRVRETSRHCMTCRRALCARCYEGLHPDGQEPGSGACATRPDGEGVR
jgi:hypothetical protein